MWGIERRGGSGALRINETVLITFFSRRLGRCKRSPFAMILEASGNRAI
jgi:hypothetical protein